MIYLLRISEVRDQNVRLFFFYEISFTFKFNHIMTIKCTNELLII